MLPLSEIELRKFKAHAQSVLSREVTLTYSDQDKLAIMVLDLIREIARGDEEFRERGKQYNLLAFEHKSLKEKFPKKKPPKKMPWEEIFGPLGPPQDDSPDPMTVWMGNLSQRVACMEEQE